MPIPIEELTRLSRPLEERIFEFLAARPLAYTMTEIVGAMQGVGPHWGALLMSFTGPDWKERVRPYADAMRTLIDRGQVGTSTANGSEYFFLKRS